MKLPKQKFQKNYMGKTCEFTKELIRIYDKKKITDHNLGFFGHQNFESCGVKWKAQGYKKKTGWIVGFGWSYEGSIEKDGNDKYFNATKRVNYVRVRTTPTGSEIKVPMNNIVLTHK